MGPAGHGRHGARSPGNRRAHDGTGSGARCNRRPSITNGDATHNSVYTDRDVTRLPPGGGCLAISTRADPAPEEV
jgi:hypothetical protein